jgi:mannose-6-phosphate isomerase-like protein (cupin superfamily)
VQAAAVRRGGRSVTPLGRQPGGVPIFRLTLPPALSTVQRQVHDGTEWLLVLAGRLRIVLGDNEFVLEPDDAAEFDPRVPHGFANAGEEPVDFLGLFGPEGQRQHVTLRRPAPEGPS